MKDVHDKGIIPHIFSHYQALPTSVTFLIGKSS